MLKIKLNLLLLSLCILSSCCHKTSGKKMILIQGNLQYLNSYCLGVAPTPAQEKELKNLKPLEGFKLMVKQGVYNDINKNVFSETITDENGKFEFHLPKENYVLLTDYHVDNTIITKENYLEISDKKAYESWLKQGLKQFSESGQLNQIWKKKCFVPIGLPNVRYTGPEVP